MNAYECLLSIKSYFEGILKAYYRPYSSIGSYFLGKDKHTICIIGDGSLMMTMQELGK